MKRIFLLCSTAVIVGLAGCGDFSNRVYRYQDEIPLDPFVIQLTRTEYRIKPDRLNLKVWLHVANKSPETKNLARDRFTLRIGEAREVAQGQTFRDALGIGTVSFKPGEFADVTLAFSLPPDALGQRLALIVDRQRKKGADKERLTLIEVKRAWSPKTNQSQGEWFTVRSARWE